MLDATSKTAAGTIPSFRILVNSSGSVIVAANNTTPSVGVSQDTSAVSGQKLPVYGPGQTVKLTASAAIAAGARIMAAADGKIATWATGAGRYSQGYTLEPAAADGDVIWCVFEPDNIPATA